MLEQLPPEGEPSAKTRESGNLDFKQFADPRNSWEHAKDLAAFANMLGGALLIGAAENAGALTYPGISQSAKDVQTIYESAARMCSPPPVVDPTPIHLGDGRIVVAVNVQASVDVIAAPASFRDAQGNKVQIEGWSYPRRVGSQTGYIAPAELPMFMTRDARRGFLLANRIPPGATAGLTVLSASPRLRGYAGVPVEYGKIVLDLRQSSLESNFVEFSGKSGKEIVRVPLMDIVDVWEHLPGKWSIRLAGKIERQDRGSQFGSGVRVHAGVAVTPPAIVSDSAGWWRFSEKTRRARVR